MFSVMKFLSHHIKNQNRSTERISTPVTHHGTYGKDLWNRLEPQPGKHDFDMWSRQASQGGDPLLSLIHSASYSSSNISPPLSHSFGTLPNQEFAKPFWKPTRQFGGPGLRWVFDVTPFIFTGRSHSPPFFFLSGSQPFGEGVVTMPQRKENNLLLWSLDNLTTPVHSFAGHQDIPREFVWRCGNPASYEYQLVSIAKEQDLRLWKVERQHIVACGTSKEDAAELLREGSPKTGGMSSSLKAESPKTHFEVTPQNLAHEFSLVNRQIHNIVIEQVGKRDDQGTSLKENPPYAFSFVPS